MQRSLCATYTLSELEFEFEFEIGRGMKHCGACSDLNLNHPMII